MAKRSAAHDGHVMGGYQNPTCLGCQREQRIEAKALAANPPQTREAEGARYCDCTADTQLGADPTCSVCRHRDHGPSGCRARIRRTPEAQRDAPRMADHPETQWNDLDPELAALRAGGQRDAGNRGIDPERGILEAVAWSHAGHDLRLQPDLSLVCVRDGSTLIGDLAYRATQPPAAGTEGGE